jgi:hypothetical protein
MPTKKTKSKKANSKTGTTKRANPKKKASAKAKLGSSKKVRAKRPARRKSGRRRIGGRASEGELLNLQQPGLGAASGGQSGDIQGLSATPETDSESVEELLEEGQSFEAEVVSGVENALDPDESEVRTREVPENDVPEEYIEEDDDSPERDTRNR